MEELITIVFLLLPLLLLLILWIFKKKSWRTWVVFVLNTIPIGITIVLTICSIPKIGLTISKITELNPFLWGAYTVAIGAIEYLIDQYKKMMPQTKESYEFNNRYSSIQDQWEIIKKNGGEIQTKRLFIDESLRIIADSITLQDFYYNSLSDSKIEDFATIVGTLSKDYILLCSNQNKYYNAIFASLYKYLFSEYKTNVLSPIQPNSNESADLIIPEFVSNGLTQIIINESSIVDYQHNTSVSTIDDFQDNVKDGTELKGFIPNGYLKRILITNEIDNPQNINIEKFKKIKKWHDISNVELRFITRTEAEQQQRRYSGIDRLDFSVIKMKDVETGYFILGADKNTNRIIAGEKHEMYSVKCVSTQEQPDSDKLFADLWDLAKTGEIDNNNNVVFKNNNNYSL